jgi:hypothetical protein
MMADVPMMLPCPSRTVTGASAEMSSYPLSDSPVHRSPSRKMLSYPESVIVPLIVWVLLPPPHAATSDCQNRCPCPHRPGLYPRPSGGAP